MLNRVVLVGRLARDPFELRRSSATGTAAISFTVAVDNRFSKQEDRSADFISCVCFNKAAEFVDQYCRKGALVGVEGRLQTRNYEDKDGHKVFVTEVVCDNVQILESKNARENREQEPSSPVEPQSTRSRDVGIDIDEDELPF